MKGYEEEINGGRGAFAVDLCRCVDGECRNWGAMSPEKG
jgi:hypothetical protein